MAGEGGSERATAEISFETLGHHDTEFRVPFGFVDGYGTCWHGHAAAFFEIARADLARPFGVGAAALRKEGLVVPMLEMGCEYKNPAFDDEMLVIESTLLRPSLPLPQLSFRYRVTRPVDGKEIFRGHTRQQIARHDGRLIVRIPPPVRDGLAAIWDYLAGRPRWA
jgi:acyl-CoA thioester hydrolase